VLRTDSKLRATAAPILAARRQLKSMFMAKFPGEKLGGYSQRLLSVTNKVQLDMFQNHGQ
jgi:hypothetical protein